MDDDNVQDVQEKFVHLQEYLKELGSLAVAFSGGVDSTFLLKVAHDVLGDRAIAVTAGLHSFPRRESDEAEAFCKKEGIRHFSCDINELEIEGFCNNPPNRCYICKKEIFQTLWKLVHDQGIVHLAEGSNMDDTGDYRPGMIAIAQMDILSPLRKAGLYKSEIRELSKALGLSVWKKPSFACLASRFAYGERITKEKLEMVDKAEQLLLDKGFHQIRVRIHDKMARIEVLPDEFDKLIEKSTREEIVLQLKSYGFTYVSMDLNGYRTGSMNEILSKEDSYEV